MIQKIIKIVSLNLFIFLFVAGMGLPILAGSAGKTVITTVEGIIENIPDDTIVVRDKRYTITGVRLLKASGKDAKKDELKRGKKVEIFFQNKQISSILIYGDVKE